MSPTFSLSCSNMILHGTFLKWALLIGLEDVISMSSVGKQDEMGWNFDAEGDQADPLFGFKYLHQLYQKADGQYTGRVVVPVLWDKMKATIVSTESIDIMRMLNTLFHKESSRPDDSALDYYPTALKGQIDVLNDDILNDVNLGVYKCCFAPNQSAYDTAVQAVFERLEALESGLVSSCKYLAGDRMTETDIRLFTTLIRFDLVYHNLFKCNKKRIQDYPNLSKWLKLMYDQPRIRPTVQLESIKRHYFTAMLRLNPSGIVPIGPDMSYLTDV